MKKKLPSWDVVHNYNVSSMGRIWILYNKDIVSINPLIKHNQFIHCSLSNGDMKLNCTVVYGSYVSEQRLELWEKLRLISENMTEKWVIMGDFNAVMSNSDRIGGVDIDSQAGLDFKNWSDQANVIELKHQGHVFTWFNNQRGDKRIWRKLDWCFVNEIWMENWVDSYCRAENAGISDHCPLVVNFGNIVNDRRSIFRFFNIWCNHPRYHEIVSNSWNVRRMGSKMFQVYQKLKFLRHELRSLNKRDFSGISERVNQTRVLLSNLQAELLKDPFNEILHDEERAISINLHRIMSWEESILRQKARVLWIKLGDHNTKFFHRSLIQRQSRKKIISLKMPDGNFCTDPDKIKEMIVKHFEDFIGSKNSNRVPAYNTLIGEGIVLDDIDRTALDMEVSDEEVKSAIFSINNDKAPGPDGFSSAFFKHSWSIVGEEVSNAILEFFSSGKMLKQANSTIITLIPKVDCPETIGEYRPIACCNVIYKGISKIIARRIKKVLNKIINPCQSAFVPGRNIADNILLAHEVVRNYHRGKGNNCALKVDIQKAYDSLEWDFIEEVIIGFRFPDRFIKLTMECIRSSMFSVMVNGEITGFFPGGRGLR
ncbi:uncharacterized protein LOC126681659 [Mercurialis annua]|uniref:uncharacterized protein LOC126681659 n=1 Tax=Mercurialis annua TaxID=3986 RepID=UPI00215FBD99|nr:uncharacterized protein LOC126681659 [Mercurialis annua]